MRHCATSSHGPSQALATMPFVLRTPTHFQDDLQYRKPPRDIYTGPNSPWRPLKVNLPLILAPSQNAVPKKKRNAIRPRSCLCNRPRGVTVSTLDSESSDRGSNPREVSRQIFENWTEKTKSAHFAVDNNSHLASMRHCATNTACCGHALGTTLHTFQKPRDSQTTE